MKLTVRRRVDFIIGSSESPIAALPDIQMLPLLQNEEPLGEGFSSSSCDMILKKMFFFF
jgi:hypothetical protein